MVEKKLKSKQFNKELKYTAAKLNTKTFILCALTAYTNNKEVIEIEMCSKMKKERQKHSYYILCVYIQNFSTIFFLTHI